MEIGEQYTAQILDETTGKAKAVTFEVVSAQDNVCESVQISV